MTNVKYGMSQEMDKMLQGFAIVLIADITMVMATLILLSKYFPHPITILVALPHVAGRGRDRHNASTILRPTCRRPSAWSC